MFRPKARKSDQVQMHLLPPRCCFALAALVWPATEASLTIRTALGTVDLGLLQQPNSQQAHHLRTCLAVGKQGDHFSAAMCHVLSAEKSSCLCLEHVTIKLWTLQQNKTHIYNHIYIISEYTFAASCNILMACPDRASSWSNLLLKCCKDFASTTMTSRTIRLWSMSPERSER